MQEVIIGYQGEMSLKGLNRNQFESATIKILRYRVKDAGRFRIWCAQSTFYIEPEDAEADLDLAFARKNQPDSETLCTMARSLGSKDKLEILRRCAQSPSTAAKLAAAMNLNSGTVSRNLYSLYKLGLLETRDDGERVNYVTRLDAIHQLFRWIADYIGGGS